MNAREREVMDALAESMRAWITWADENYLSCHGPCGNANCKTKVALANLAAYDALVAQDSSAGSGEPVGRLDVSRYRGSDAMVNVDFEYLGNLPDGSYRLYLHPQPDQAPRDAGDEARDAARYRWLRANSDKTNRNIQEMWAACKPAYPSSAEWDAAIDAAIAAQQRQGERT